MSAPGAINVGGRKVVRINGSQITGWESSHDPFSTALGFPNRYGRNMDAWIDCMSHLDTPSTEMRLTIHIDNSTRFREAAPEQWLRLLECSGLVNGRRIQRGNGPLLALSFAG